MPRLIRVGDVDDDETHFAPTDIGPNKMIENDCTVWANGGAGGTDGGLASVPFSIPTVSESPAMIAAQRAQIAQDPEAIVNDRSLTNDQVPQFGPTNAFQDPATGSAIPAIDPATGQPRSATPPSTTAAEASDIVPFLRQLLAEAANGQWDETKPVTGQSNPNIIGIWAELGYPTSNPYWTDDQTPWCMGFVNWVLKRTGYRWLQEAGAAGIRTRSAEYRNTQVPLSEGRPGDVCYWSYSHVNFIYTVPRPGTYTFVGGNQSDRGRNDNNPSNGSITESWASGYTVPGNGTLVSIWRPSRA